MCSLPTFLCIILKFQYDNTNFIHLYQFPIVYVLFLLQKRSHNIEKERTTVSPHTSPEKMSGTSKNSRTIEEYNNIEQQTATLIEDIQVLEAVTCRKTQVHF